ncbi:MAG TPA: maleylpyruvate isomerase N-terminal domain-containing protein, partial [Pedococcus sp.]
MDADAALPALARVTAAMARAVERADPAAAVPACPGWDVTTLVDHLGRVHLWAAAAARTGEEPRP